MKRLPESVLALFILAISTFPFAQQSRATEYHAAPGGTAAGDGSAAKPWDLKTALSSPAVKAGDTVRLAAGTYHAGGVTCKLHGTAQQPVTVRGAAATADGWGDRATLDCKPASGTAGAAGAATLFQVDGEHVVLRDFEVTNSDPRRQTDVTGSHPQDLERGGLNVAGSHLSLINLLVHDCGNGIGFWSNGEGGTIYGCVIFNNGWKAPDRGHGHAVYTQNKVGTKTIADCVLFNQFSYGIHAYGSSRAFLSGYDIEGNIAFNNGASASPDSRTPNILVGGGCPAERIRVSGNFTWTKPGATSVNLGYSNKHNKDLTPTDNYIVGGLSATGWEQVTASGNTVIGPNSLDPKADPAARPGGVKVFVRPNRHEGGRANIAVYNWDRRDEVDVDLAGVLKKGQAYSIVSAQDFLGQSVAKGVYDGGPVKVSMKPGHPVSPVGWEGHPPPVTEPEFGAFVVLPGR